MALLTITDTLGNSHKVEFASSLSELPYSRKIDFDVAVEDIAIWAAEQAENEDLKGSENATAVNQDAYYCYLLARAVSKYTGYDFNSVMQFDVSDLLDTHGNLLPHVVDSLDKPANKIDYSNAEQTLHTIYQAARNVINGYQFEYRPDGEHFFTHKGKLWRIPNVVKQLFTGAKVYSPFSTQQAVETLMVKNYLNEKVNNRPRAELTAQQVEDLRFTAHLNLIAISVTEHVKGDNGKPVEVPLPLDKNEFDTTIADRAILFEDVDSKTAMDIIFFLTATTANYVLTRRITTISTPPKATIANG